MRRRLAWASAAAALLALAFLGLHAFRGVAGSWKASAAGSRAGVSAPATAGGAGGEAGGSGRPDAGARPSEPAGPFRGRVRVEVLNAGGRPGVARAATERLRDRGFDVVYFGNADEFGRDSSVVLRRAGRREDAEAVARALGIGRVADRPDASLLLEATVLLGVDWRPSEAPGPAVPPRSPVRFRER